MTSEPGCLFCRIVAGEIPSDVVREDVRTLAFRDIDPKAPTHVLVIPKDHYPNITALSAADSTLTAELFAAAADVADQEGVGEGYRLVANTGSSAGQSVFHVHVHVLGGRLMSWPPG